MVVKRRDENRILRRAMELNVEGRRPVDSPKKTWSKVVEEDMKKLNITEDIHGREKQLVEETHIMSNPKNGKLGTITKMMMMMMMMMISLS